MADDQGLPVTPVNELQFTAIGESPAVYADGVTANVTPSTITLDFTHHEPWYGPETYRTLVKVQFSPVQFKALSALLPAMVQQYEEQFGEISVPGLEITSNIVELTKKPAEEGK